MAAVRSDTLPGQGWNRLHLWKGTYGTTCLLLKLQGSILKRKLQESILKRPHLPPCTLPLYRRPFSAHAPLVTLFYSVLNLLLYLFTFQFPFKHPLPLFFLQDFRVFSHSISYPKRPWLISPPPHCSALTLSLTANVIYDLDFLNKDCSKSSEVKNFWEF